VDVLRALFQLGKASQHVPGVLVERVIDLQENALVSLDDDWVLGIVAHDLLRIRFLRAIIAQNRFAGKCVGCFGAWLFYWVFGSVKGRVA
jgi:hypothetical protein